ncbi:hypothetical protein LshimejAT787_0606280 [Lyophyllum shimeji]|uniref:Uncharacterized protein n=1 Tax=Lyophyllum shimeji TaxID=47721 RepID=A0A9P3PQD3_LYOSH|nr:hypothetical protein LshimejAT787_0606280 [Lyophyllum shimeji]
MFRPTAKDVASSRENRGLLRKAFVVGGRRRIRRSVKTPETLFFAGVRVAQHAKGSSTGSAGAGSVYVPGAATRARFPVEYNGHLGPRRGKKIKEGTKTLATGYISNAQPGARVCNGSAFRRHLLLLAGPHGDHSVFSCFLIPVRRHAVGPRLVGAFTLAVIIDLSDRSLSTTHA